jgi:Fe-S cluster assembly protein SufD
VRLNGENGKCYLGGCKILDGDQHNDTTILIEHMAPNCYSNQNYRNVLNGQSRGVFQGKVYVDQIAQQTDGYQLCNTILQSDRAEMSTKPELEIYADDVKCSHGATTAQTDEEPLFYLQARGIPKDQARTILMQSFVTESLEAFEDNEDIYEQLSAKINDALGL